MKPNIKKSFSRRHIKKNKINLFHTFIKNTDWSKVFMSILTIAVVTFVSAYYYLPNKVSWKIGDTSTKTIIAKSSATYRDTYSENILKNQANANDIVYDYVPEAKDKSMSNVNLIFAALLNERKNETSNSAEKIKTLQISLLRYVKGDLSDKSIYTLLSISDEDFYMLKENALLITSSIMLGEVKEDIYCMRQMQSDLKKEVDKAFNQKSELGNICYQILLNVIKPNMIYNKEKTDEAIAKRQKDIKPIFKTIRTGDVVVRQGDMITPGTKESLEAIGIYTGKAKYEHILSIFLYVLLAFMLVVIYINQFSNFKNDKKGLLLLCLIIVVNFLLFFITGTMFESTFDLTKTSYIGAMWLISIAMLIFVLFGKQAAWIVLILLSILLAYIMGNDTRIAAVSIITGISAIYAVSKIRSRSDIINVYIIIMLITFLQVVIYGLIYNDSIKIIFNEYVKWEVLIIPISTFMFMLFSSIFEKLFDITTPMRLIELSDTNLPLLKRLAIEAPGTYAHSITVAHIAEAGADAIGADSLMTRIGAYYHDIGKLNQPQYFSENQYGINVHDELNPTLSSMIIQSHIKNGIDLAFEHKLPQTVIDTIMQHHGTSLVAYFYNQFAETNVHSSSLAIEEQFRYPGPKVQTKEAGILMLADSVEAASRSLKDPTITKIETLVNNIVTGKIIDGQLNECPLTLRDINTMKSSFVKTISHLLHSRIAYPEQIKEKEVIDGNSNNQQPEIKEPEEIKDSSNSYTEKS